MIMTPDPIYVFRNSGHKERKGIKVFIVGGAKEKSNKE